MAVQKRLHELCLVLSQETAEVQPCGCRQVNGSTASATRCNRAFLEAYAALVLRRADLAECKTLETKLPRVFWQLRTVSECRSVTRQAGNSYAPLQPRSAVGLRAVPCLRAVSAAVLKIRAEAHVRAAGLLELDSLKKNSTQR